MSMRANASRLFIGLLFLSGCSTATSATSQAVSGRGCRSDVQKWQTSSPRIRMVRSAAVLWNHGGERRSSSLPQLEPLLWHEATSFSFPIEAGKAVRQRHTSWTCSCVKMTGNGAGNRWN
jgi:hypothetical protein